jgi:hypothetical protein
MVSRVLLVAFLLCPAACLLADGPADNIPEKVRPVPPPGIGVPEAHWFEFRDAVAELGSVIADLRTTLKDKPDLLQLLPDVEIFHKAVSNAHTAKEIYDVKTEVPAAFDHLKRGLERAKLLAEGKAPWTTQTGLVVRGYVSKIDGSVQPYGLVVPASYQAGAPHQHRLDVWCHGRGEKLTELNFLEGRLKSPGEFTPPHAFVLHLYGRYCNANKFAGEIDCLEAMEHVEKHYPIDTRRRVIRGFSMGGAACWQFAVHYPSLWAAAAPGAGFSETPEFLRDFQKETLNPTWYEKKLWHMYDCTDYAGNLFNCPTVAYSGEKDIQKQAADKMAEAMEKEGLSLVHLIGPNTGHSYHKDTKVELNRRIDQVVALGRKPVPERVNFTTWTLRYNRCAWVRVEGIEEHWERATIAATLRGNEVQVRTKNVTAFSLVMEPGECLLDEHARPRVIIDDKTLVGASVQSDRSWTSHFRKTDGKWESVESLDDGTLRKRHGLQGPIDDAFMDSFLMVRPSGKPINEKVGLWVVVEMKRAIEHWRRQFRGEPRVTSDEAVTDADIAAHNLILWGDPASNKVLAKIASKLPIHWTADTIQVGGESFPAEHHALVLIFPNPLNPKRYVVLNSGFTFRDYDYLNNARQVPKLPDYAVIDLRTPPSSQWPGKVATAGFFNESWGLKAQGK